jgi:hypothetical protein
MRPRWCAPHDGPVSDDAGQHAPGPEPVAQPAARNLEQRVTPDECAEDKAHLDLADVEFFGNDGGHGGDACSIEVGYEIHQADQEQYEPTLLTGTLRCDGHGNSSLWSGIRWTDFECPGTMGRTGPAGKDGRVCWQGRRGEQDAIPRSFIFSNCPDLSRVASSACVAANLRHQAARVRRNNDHLTPRTCTSAPGFYSPEAVSPVSAMPGHQHWHIAKAGSGAQRPLTCQPNVPPSTSLLHCRPKIDLFGTAQSAMVNIRLKMHVFVDHHCERVTRSNLQGVRDC